MYEPDLSGDRRLGDLEGFGNTIRRHRPMNRAPTGVRDWTVHERCGRRIGMLANVGRGGLSGDFLFAGLRVIQARYRHTRT
jgi:hypothetical protein